MKKTHLLALVMAVVLVVGYSLDAEASAILSLTDTATLTNLTCDTSLPTSATNCNPAAGFIAAGNNIILSNGIVGGFTIANAILLGGQPGNPIVGNLTANETNVMHLTDTGNLQVDFGGNDFSLPAGPGLFLGASDTGNWGLASAGDQKLLQSWGRATNDLVIPGGTATAIAPPCLAGSAGLNRTCNESITDVPFLRGAGNYALTGREVITQATSDLIGADYTARITANATQVNPVPEPASALMLGMGSILLLAARRWAGSPEGGKRH